MINENSIKYHKLKHSVLLDRFLNINTWYYDMHGIVTTHVVVSSMYVSSI